jgi:hypothetical protein
MPRSAGDCTHARRWAREILSSDPTARRPE